VIVGAIAARSRVATEIANSPALLTLPLVVVVTVVIVAVEPPDDWVPDTSSGFAPRAPDSS
jgi:hypothetical protein